MFYETLQLLHEPTFVHLEVESFHEFRRTALGEFLFSPAALFGSSGGAVSWRPPWTLQLSSTAQKPESFGVLIGNSDFVTSWLRWFFRTCAMMVLRSHWMSVSCIVMYGVHPIRPTRSVNKALLWPPEMWSNSFHQLQYHYLVEIPSHPVSGLWLTSGGLCALLPPPQLQSTRTTRVPSWTGQSDFRSTTGYRAVARTYRRCV